jgi:hypothetical protein
MLGLMLKRPSHHTPSNLETQRIGILYAVLEYFAESDYDNFYRILSQENLQRWSQNAVQPLQKVEVLSGDWGEVTGQMTQRHGVCYAVLNMANAYCPGGGYKEGMVAQEENMFRRTDCHFSLTDATVDPVTGLYHKHFTELLEGRAGEVFLDIKQPRICICGEEDLTRGDLGYRFLDAEVIFPFYELRAAAVDIFEAGGFDPAEMKRRIEAQLNTLIQKDVKHVVLSAFGCGAFGNPASAVAEIYAEAIQARADAFEHIVFAIFNAGYGHDNFSPFESVFQQKGLI